MASPSSAAMLMESIAQVPLGFGENEGQLNSPYNRGKENVLVRVRNLSATRSRLMFDRDRPSWLRGGEQLEQKIKKRYPTFSLDVARRDAFVGAGASMDKITEEGVFPVDVTLKFDDQLYRIPAKDEDGKDAPWVDVPEGVMDLYYGNWKRMNSDDPKERSEEIESIKRRRGNNDKNVVIRPGENNKWAFLEFERKLIKHETFAVDAARLYADRLVEI